MSVDLSIPGRFAPDPETWALVDAIAEHFRIVRHPDLLRLETKRGTLLLRWRNRDRYPEHGLEHGIHEGIHEN